MISNIELHNELVKSIENDIMSNELFNILLGLTIHYANKRFTFAKLVEESTDFVMTSIIEHGNWKQYPYKRYTKARPYMSQIILCKLANFSLRKYKGEEMNK